MQIKAMCGQISLLSRESPGLVRLGGQGQLYKAKMKNKAS